MILDSSLRDLRRYARECGISSLCELWDDVDEHDERLSQALDDGAWVVMAHYFASDSRGIDAFVERFALTAREREVLLHTMSGCVCHEVADRLAISMSCVKFHVGNILRKCGCANMREVRQVLRDNAHEGVAE